MTTSALPIHGSGDSATALEHSEAPSAGAGATRWINPPISRPGVIPLRAAGFREVGPYAIADSGGGLFEVRNEMALMSYAAAASFFEFEDMLAENPEEGE